VLARTHRLQQLLHAYPELSVAPRDDGVIVSGYVSDPAARERVAQIVAGVDNAALGNIYVVSDLVATAQTYFSDTALSVAYLGRGRIELTGTAARAQIEPRIRNYMKDARPALEVVDHVRDADAGQPRTTTTLGGTAGIPEITTVFAGDGDQRYIETADGSRYFEGARLKEGPSVVSIGPDEVVFERNGQRITMPLGGPSAGAPERAPAPVVPPLASGAAAGVAQPVPGPTLLPDARPAAAAAAPKDAPHSRRDRFMRIARRAMRAIRDTPRSRGASRRRWGMGPPPDGGCSSRKGAKHGYDSRRCDQYGRRAEAGRRPHEDAARTDEDQLPGSAVDRDVRNQQRRDRAGRDGERPGCATPEFRRPRMTAAAGRAARRAMPGRPATGARRRERVCRPACSGRAAAARTEIGQGGYRSCQ
jgi:hypothetical protein